MGAVQRKACGMGMERRSNEKRRGKYEVLGDAAVVTDRYVRCEGLRRSWRREVCGKEKQECRIAADLRDQII